MPIFIHKAKRLHKSGFIPHLPLSRNKNNYDLGLQEDEFTGKMGLLCSLS